MAQAMTLEETAALAASVLPPARTENVPLLDCAGRVLAENIFARADYPAAPQALWTGWALRTADLDGVRSGRSIRLTPVDGRIPLTAGQTAAVFAGDFLPPGCDGVAPLSDCQRASDGVLISRPLWPFDGCRRQGSGYRAGTLLCPAQTTLNAATLGLLAGDGHDQLHVFARPTYALVGFPPQSAAALTGRLAELGAVPAANPQFFLRANGSAALTAERLLSIRPSLEGCEEWGVGKAEVGAVFLLSGSLTGALLDCELLVRPWLDAQLGRPLRKPLSVPLSTAFTRSSPQRRFLFALLEQGRAALPPEGALSPLSKCNGLVELPAGSPPLPVGAVVKFWPL